MDIKKYLLEQGYSEDEATTLAGDQKMAKAIGAALTRHEEATRAQAAADKALQDARAEREQLNQFWTGEALPKLTAADTKLAKAEAERARYATYLKSLKDAGYDVPDDLVAAAPPTPAKNQSDPGQPGNYLTREDFQKELMGFAPSMITLGQVSNEYSDLVGGPYLTMESDFEEARKANKPFSAFVREKYDFQGKRAAREQKKLQDTIDAKVAEQLKTKEAELAAKYGSNGEMRVQVPSKFDSMRTNEHKDSWKTHAGRDQAKKDRLSRFANIQ